MNQDTNQVSRGFLFLANKEYIKDFHTLSYKSGNAGQFTATLRVMHETEKVEKIIFYAMLEGEGTLLEFSVAGVKKVHHLVDVPRHGEVDFIFTFEDLPPGNHIIYLLTEDYLNPFYIEEECKGHIGFVYFAIEVENAKKKSLSNHVELFEYNGHTCNKDKKMKIPQITLFKDKKMKKLVESVCSGSYYYLAINNPYDFEYDANLNVLVNYELNQLGKMTIPQSSKLVFPIILSEELLEDKQSILFLLIGKPIKAPNEYGIPERIRFFSKRLEVFRLY